MDLALNPRNEVLKIVLEFNGINITKLRTKAPYLSVELIILLMQEIYWSLLLL